MVYVSDMKKLKEWKHIAIRFVYISDKNKITWHDKVKYNVEHVVRNYKCYIYICIFVGNI